MDVVKTNIELIGGTVDIALGAGPRHDLHDQDPADAGDRRGADRQRRRASASPSRRSRCSSSCGSRPGSEHAIERINGTPVLRLRDRLLPIVPLSTVLGLPGRKAAPADDGFVVVTQVGRAALRHPRRRRLPHRGNRREADVLEAAAHPALLRQHHPRRRRGGADHRSERPRPHRRLGGRATSSSRPRRRHRGAAGDAARP